MAGTQNDVLPYQTGRGRDIAPYAERADPFAPTSLLAASPWQLMRRMQEEMDRLWPALGTNTLAGSTVDQQIWAPNVDITEAIKHWNIEVDLPGVNTDDISVAVRDRQLIIKAELKNDESREQARYYRRERRYGFFERVLPLPDSVDEDAITCAFSNGVLNINVPKKESEETNTRRIPIGDKPPQQ